MQHGIVRMVYCVGRRDAFRERTRVSLEFIEVDNAKHAFVETIVGVRNELKHWCIYGDKKD